jgi:hypothetical protein
MTTNKPTKPQIQGEGDYDAARRYRKDVEDFVATEDVDAAAHAAAPRTEQENWLPPKSKGGRAARATMAAM